MQNNPSVDNSRPVTQFERILSRFNMNAAELARLLNEEASHVYRWNYPPERGGTAGVIPRRALTKIIELSRLYGVLLTSDDLDPRRLPK